MKALLAGLIYTLAGEPVKNGAVLIEKDKIVGVVGKEEIPDGIQTMDFSSCVITPGLIDAHTHIAMFGIRDLPESNEIVNPVIPEFRVQDGWNPKNEFIARTRSAGFTCCCLLPGSANIIGGTGIVVKLIDAKNVDAMRLGPAQIKMALGENPRRCYGQDRSISPMTRMGNARIMRETMRSAYEYYTASESDKPMPYNAKWEAMRCIFSGEAVVHIHAHRMDDILTAMYIMEEYGARYCVDHVTDGHLVADILAQHGVNCIVGPISCGPQKQETWHCTPRCAGVLERAGVKNICLTVDGDMQVCTLPLDVGISMAHGLSQEAALSSVTLSPARVLGIEDRVGSIETGKDADIAVFDGFPFSNYTKCRGTMINGEYFDNREEIWI